MQRYGDWNGNRDLRDGAAQPAWGNPHYEYIRSLIENSMREPTGDFKNKIARKVSYLIPNRVVYWVLIRAYAFATVHVYPKLTPEEIAFEKLLYSWEYKTDLKRDDTNH